MRDIRPANDGANGKPQLAAQGRREAHVVSDVAKAAQDAAHFLGHLLVRAFALAPVDQTDVEVGVVGGAVGVRLDELDLGQGFDAMGHLRDGSHRALQRAAFGKIERALQLALVVGRDEVAAHPAIEKEAGGKRDQADHQYHDAVRERPLQAAQVETLDDVEKLRLPRARVSTAGPHHEDPGAHHRRQREAHQQRDQDGHGHRPAERVDVAPRIAAHKRDRQEDDHQRERGGHHRQPDFASGLDRGPLPLHAFFLHVAKDVFQHDDRVVDHDANGQRQRQ